MRISYTASSIVLLARSAGFVAASCSTETVKSGDSCSSLASECGISASDFTKYNPQPNLCSTLSPGQKVCCTTGGLPVPQKNSNGTCATYYVQSQDTCSAIASSNSITTDNIATWNDGTTWGWSGCSNLQAGSAICLSSGYPPFPPSVNGTKCGPQVAGTKQIAGKAFANYNPCPLNACCDKWGQCGITPEFCTNTTGPTGNPGTSPSGSNGCISNCGTKIVTGPARSGSSFSKVAYYESWNWDRPCLNYRVNQIDSSYTHYHWSFATLSTSFQLGINDTYEQWQYFQAITAQKRIISIGGWGFSTDTSTYDLLRQAMEPANVDTFVTNTVNFVANNKLDGVDIDWEYPGAPDIPGIPPGQPSDGPNYLTYLQKLRKALPSSKTISIAAPASFWYLQHFPISNMSKELSYIVYETYDLHGQWDYGNNFTDDGCPNTSCLRSHVNLTETNYALAMLTKAGVSASQIVVGVASYGRSFGMVDPSCTGPDCQFQGPNSTALGGQCTGTAGYIANAEILNIIAFDNSTYDGGPSIQKSFHDSVSDSDILVYDNNQWVAYMSNTTLASRTSYYQSLGFAGTSLWAIDLSAFGPFDGYPYHNTTFNGSGCDPSIYAMEAKNDWKVPTDCIPINEAQLPLGDPAPQTTGKPVTDTTATLGTTVFPTDTTTTPGTTVFPTGTVPSTLNNDPSWTIATTMSAATDADAD